MDAAADFPCTADATDAADAADATDADAFEFLSRRPIDSAASSLEEVEIARSPDHLNVSQPPEDPPNRADSQPNTELVIQRFPFGRPGAPIDGAHQDATVYPGDSVWAPFRSECDWEVARWAKMEGTSSSAITKLLAIPGVRAT